MPNMPRRFAGRPIQLVSLAAAMLLGACSEGDLPVAPETTTTQSAPAFSLVTGADINGEETPTLDLPPILVTELTHGYRSEFISNAHDRFEATHPDLVISPSSGDRVRIRIEAPPEHAFVLHVPADYSAPRINTTLRWALPERARGPTGFIRSTASYTFEGVEGGSVPHEISNAVHWDDDLKAFKVTLQFGVTEPLQFAALQVEFDLDPGGSANASGTYSEGLYRFGAGATGIGSLPDAIIMSIADLRSPALRIETLIALVEGMNLHQGITSALTARLYAALAAVSAENADLRPDAANHLVAFVHTVEAQAGKKLTLEQADVLADAATAIIVDLTP